MEELSVTRLIAHLEAKLRRQDALIDNLYAVLEDRFKEITRLRPSFKQEHPSHWSELMARDEHDRKGIILSGVLAESKDVAPEIVRSSK
jgi:hypothetical protein